MQGTCGRATAISHDAAARTSACHAGEPWQMLAFPGFPPASPPAKLVGMPAIASLHRTAAKSLHATCLGCEAPQSSPSATHPLSRALTWRHLKAAGTPRDWPSPQSLAPGYAILNSSRITVRQHPLPQQTSPCRRYHPPTSSRVYRPSMACPSRNASRMPSGCIPSATTHSASRSSSQRRIHQSKTDCAGWKSTTSNMACGARARRCWSATSTTTRTS